MLCLLSAGMAFFAGRQLRRGADGYTYIKYHGVESLVPLERMSNRYFLALRTLL